MGGAIRAESALGEGATFVVILERADRDARQSDSVILEVIRHLGVPARSPR